MAHDLNNILTGIVSYPDLLLMDDDMRPEQREAIEAIRNAGLRAAASSTTLDGGKGRGASPGKPLNLNPPSTTTCHHGAPETA